MTPTYTADLFPPLHAELIALLRGFDESAWNRPTLAPKWRVRDVAAHMLDGDLRRLSACRDAHMLSAGPVHSFADVLRLIHDLNSSGVTYAARLSRQVITDLLEVTGRWVSSYVDALEPHGPACFAVAWAGEDQSENWMDVGREYTERWHHQMQIRHAVGADELLSTRWLYPLLDLSVRAFPRAYEKVSAKAGTAVAFEVDAEGEHLWSVVYSGSRWAVMRGKPPEPAASLRTDAGTSWKLLYNALPIDAARERVTISGDVALVEPMIRTRSVMV